MTIKNNYNSVYMLISTILVLLASFANAVHAGSDTTLVEKLILAKVGTEEISLLDLQYAFKQAHGGHSILLAGTGNLEHFLDKVIEKKLLAQEGRRMEIDRRPAIAKQIEHKKRQLAAKMWNNDNITSKIEIRDREIEKAKQYIQKRWHIEMLIVPTKRSAERLRFESIGASFASIASKNSFDLTGKNGGELRNVFWGQLDPAIDEFLVEAKRGVLSQPIETSFGWALVKIVDITNVDKLDKKSIHGIKAILEERTKRDLLDKYAQKWRRKADISYNNKNFDANGWMKVDVAKQLLNNWNSDMELARIDEKVILLKDLSLNSAIKVDYNDYPRALSYLISQQLDVAIASWLIEEKAMKEGLAETASLKSQVDAFRDHLVVNALQKDIVKKGINVENKNLIEYYESHTKDYTVPERRKIIIFKVKAGVSAENVKTKLNNGSKLSDILTKFMQTSFDSPHQQNVRQGWVRPGELKVPINELVFQLEKGHAALVPDVQQSVVYVQKVMPAQLLTFDKVRQKVTDDYMTWSREQNRHDWINKLRNMTTIEKYPTAIQHAVEYLDKKAKTAFEKWEKSTDNPGGAHP